MNRRGFFSFLAAAPVGIVASATLRAEALPAPNVVRAAPTHRCGCGSPLHHFVAIDTRGRQMEPSHNLEDGGYYVSAAVCSWCQAPWEVRHHDCW